MAQCKKDLLGVGKDGHSGRKQDIEAFFRDRNCNEAQDMQLASPETVKIMKFYGTSHKH